MLVAFTDSGTQRRHPDVEAAEDGALAGDLAVTVELGEPAFDADQAPHVPDLEADRGLVGNEIPYPCGVRIAQQCFHGGHLRRSSSSLLPPRRCAAGGAPPASSPARVISTSVAG